MARQEGGGGEAVDYWVQCDLCNKWRRIPRWYAKAMDFESEGGQQ